MPAPYTSGVMDLTDAQKATLIALLQTILKAYPDIDIFYLVSQYNKQNPKSPINGDTAVSLLLDDGR